MNQNISLPCRAITVAINLSNIQDIKEDLTNIRTSNPTINPSTTTMVSNSNNSTMRHPRNRRHHRSCRQVLLLQIHLCLLDLLLLLQLSLHKPRLQRACKLPELLHSLQAGLPQRQTLRQVTAMISMRPTTSTTTSSNITSSTVSITNNLIQEQKLDQLQQPPSRLIPLSHITVMLMRLLRLLQRRLDRNPLLAVLPRRRHLPLLPRLPPQMCPLRRPPLKVLI